MSNHRTSTTDNTHKIANQVFHNGYGSVHQNNYLGLFETNAATVANGCSKEKEDDYDNDNNMLLLPHQERMFNDHDDDYFTQTDSDSSGSNQPKDKRKVLPKQASLGGTLYEIPPSLHKPFRNPSKKAAPVITPQAKRNNPAPEVNTPATAHKANPANSTATTSHSEGDNSGSHREKEQVPIDPNENVNVHMEQTVNIKLKKKKSTSVYHSSFLSNEFKPSNELLELMPELESLRPLILLQHKAFTQCIKDLGTFILTSTKILEKKSNSLQHLLNNKKIPRSLRIECELTTSPDFSSDTEFITIKNALQQEVNTFIQKGMALMTAWAKRNIKLLTLHCCSTYLKKSLQIQEGLTFFFTDAISAPTWISVPSIQITLFIFKVFLSVTYYSTNEPTTFLNLTAEQILLIGAKIILNKDSDEEVAAVLNTLDLSNINSDNQTEDLFINEIFQALPKSYISLL